MTVEWGVCSDVGVRRARNEDSFLAESSMFAVADGMGGHEGGELASSLAVAALRTLGLPATVRAVREVVASANSAIVRAQESRPELSGMGTTLVGLVVVEEDGERFWLGFNVGDSRLYQLVRGSLSIVSHDHSVVQELIDAGELAMVDARSHPERSVVTRALGSSPGPTPDLWLLPDRPGDTFLLCSDGLTNEVDEDAIASILGSASTPQAAAGQLVAAALAGGGRDNVTAIVVRNGVADAIDGHVSDDTVERPPAERDRSMSAGVPGDGR